MVWRSSFSQNMKFMKCPRAWYFDKILKIRPESDMCYAHGGTLIHKCLEKYYSGEFKNLDEIKDYFNSKWEYYDLDLDRGTQPYSLSTTRIKYKKDEYWSMIIHGINLGLHITDNEMEIEFDDVIMYLDAVDRDNHNIDDWKSSTRREENEKEYSMQVKYYAWGYYRKFGIIPNNVAVRYLKYPGSKQYLGCKPTMEDIKNAENWHWKINKYMEHLDKIRKIPKRCTKCFAYCPYDDTGICEKYEDSVLDYTITILGNYIHLKGPIDKVLNYQLNKKFSYEYIEKNYYKDKTGKLIRNEKKVENKLWNESKQLLPIGFLYPLQKTLKDYSEYYKKEINVTINDNRKFSEIYIDMPDKLLNDKVLRDYQQSAVDKFLKTKICILQMGTGSGKTEVAIECVRRLGINTLFIIDRKELLLQTKERMEKALGIKVGVIGLGKNNPCRVTVATIQTLKNVEKYRDYLRNIRFAVFDECHKMSSTSYATVCNELKNTEYRLSMSGTAFRDDGHDMLINANGGTIEKNIKSKELIKQGYLMKPKIIFIKNYITKEESALKQRIICKGLVNESLDHDKVYKEFIINGESRNNIILELTQKHNNKQILIIVKNVEHGNILESMIEGSKYLHGEIKKTEREEMFNDFKSGKLKILISTISIFAEGIDIPELDVVINAAANKASTKTVQILGRVLRKSKDKEAAYYYDFYDMTKMLVSATNARRHILSKEGHDIKILDYNMIR